METKLAQKPDGRGTHAPASQAARAGSSSATAARGAGPGMPVFLQREALEEEEELQGKRLGPLRRQPMEEEEEELMPKLRRQPMEEEEEELMPKLRRQPMEEEEEELMPKLRRQPMEEEEEELMPKLRRQPMEEEEEELMPKLRRQPMEEEEQELMPKLRRQPMEEEEEELMPKLRRQPMEEEEELMPKLHRQPLEEEEALQAKLEVGEADDEYEREADAVADRVMRMASSGAPAALQRQPIEEEEELAQPKLRRDASAAGTPDISSGSESKINQMRGNGSPLPSSVSQDLGGKMGADFSGVNVHTGADAAALNNEVNARAFTLGNDVFFNDGEYAPNTRSGQRLLAHELTHVVQQKSNRILKIRRNLPPANSPAHVPTAGPDGGPINPANEFTLRDGTFIEREQRSYPGSPTPKKRIQIPAISLPDFKERNSNRFPHVLAVRSGPRRTDQGTHWRTAVRDSVSRHLETKKQQARLSGGLDRDSNTYFFKSTRNESFTLFGNDDQLLEAAMVPFWSHSGEPSAYQIDHIVEDQLVNSDDPSLSNFDNSDKASNFELLDATANSSSGPRISAEIRRRKKTAVNNFAAEYPTERPLTMDGLTHGYFINFMSRTFDLGGVSGEPGNFWSFREITQGQHLNQMEGLSGDEMRALNRDGQPVIFSAPQGGTAHYIREADLPIHNWLPRVDLKAIQINDDPSNSEAAGSITVDAYKTDEAEQGFVESSYEDQTWRLNPVPGMYGGSIDRNSVESNVRNSLRLPGLSPIELDSVEISDQGIRAEGRVLPTIPMVANADVRISLQGNEVRLYKTFQGDEINVPAPFSISDSSLTVFLGSESGIGVEGQVNFGIERIGEGQIEASASTGGGFALDGQFNFDERIFGEGTNAQVRVGYRDEQWSMGGTLTIPEGKVPGVRSATINVDYSEAEGFSAQGDAQLDVPGVESGTLAITHSEEEGFVIGGSFNLSGDTPGIRGGSISAQVRERPDGSGYAVSASGEAQPDIPGIDSNLVVSYNDGAFTAEVEADYARGMLSGRLRAGVTNRSVGEDGQLSETAQPDNPLIVHGGGSLTIQIAPWLQGTAGVEFSPDGEITVTGEIGLPDELEIFARREIERSIFNIAVQAPIVPGIVAEVGGGLSATAGIGPGVIDELRLGITYNPAREEDTTITGDAHLNIPADAGLRLSVRAGIGLGITGASATGGLEIGGTLGIEGAAEAGVHVEWSPAQGLDLRADLSIHAQPAFTFDISGYVSVRALGFSVYDETWELASFRFGSDYRFGIRMPIHYVEGQPFDISTDDIEFEVPDIDTDQLLRGLISRIA